jgi:predicted lipoprotein with Yx(FWY)xxD motif
MSGPGHRGRGPRLAGRRRLVAVGALAAATAGAAAALVISSPFGGGSSPARTAAATRSIPPDESYVAPPASPAAKPPGPPGPPGGLVPVRPGHRSPHGPAFSSPSPAAQTLPPPSTAALTVEVATSGTFGPVLVDSNGMTLYRDTAERGGTVACTGSCARVYRPLAPRPGLRQPPLLRGHLGTLTRPDGTVQVTYDGWPLYSCSGDHAPGDTNGTGGHWQVIKTTP